MGQPCHWYTSNTCNRISSFVSCTYPYQHYALISDLLVELKTTANELALKVWYHALPPKFRAFSVSRAPTLSDLRSFALHLDLLDSHRMNIRAESYHMDPSSRTVTSPRIYAKHPVSSRLTALRFGIYPPPLFSRCKNARWRCCHTILCFLYTPLIQWRMEEFTGAASEPLASGRIQEISVGSFE